MLTEDVKLISSVSGGSVTAAWFGLRRGPGHWDGDLDGLRNDFLTKDNMATLELDAVNPITWFGLVTGQITRIEAEEALFNTQLYHDAPLAALNQPGKPYIVLNATDMAGGETFAMVPRRFDDVCSKYDLLPIATAVSASAAFPILLTPVAFQDLFQWLPGQIAQRRMDPGRSVAAAISAKPVHALSEPGRVQGRALFQRFAARSQPLPAHRLPLFSRWRARRQSRNPVIALGADCALRRCQVLRAINEGKIRKLVVIVVNARSDPPNKLYQQPQQPGLVGQIQAVTSVPIDANTANSETALSALLGELAQAAAGGTGQAKFAGMRIYGITVDYDQIPADTPAHRRISRYGQDVPTSWTLTPPQLQVTEEAGRFLLRRHPCYRALLGDLHAAQSPAGESAPPAIPCTTKIDIQRQIAAPRPSS